jgi:RNase adaptor protein for sRNA GlmZ degradation
MQPITSNKNVYQEEKRLSFPCEKHQELLKRAGSARREYEELKRLADMVIGTNDYHVLNERVNETLQKSEASTNDYLRHVREHRC